MSAYMMRFFDYTHLKPELQAVSKPFSDIATHIVNTLPNNAQRHACLTKLLEAKDCAVRAHLLGEWD